MKYSYQILIILFINCYSFSQSISGSANYKIKLSEDALSFPAVLKFNGNNSKFQYKNYNKNKWVRDEGIEAFQVVYTDSIGELVIKKANEKQLTIRSFCQKTPYVYNDEPNFDWTILEESRLIENLVCKKAITNFRGREYFAWYCPEINVNVGPWKFNGLPGLILEVYDKTDNVTITIESFKIENNIKFTTNKPTGKFVSQPQFVNCLDLEWKKKIEKNKANILKLQAQFPDIEINDGGLSRKKRLDVATELKYD